MDNEELEKEFTRKFCDVFGPPINSTLWKEATYPYEVIQFILQREQIAYSAGYGNGCADTVGEYEE